MKYKANYNELVELLSVEKSGNESPKETLERLLSVLESYRDEEKARTDQ